MPYNDHQQRVVEELDALGQKLYNLENFFSTETYGSLSDHEKSLLRTQAFSMKCYYEMLVERIKLFS